MCGNFKIQLLGYSPFYVDWYTIVQLCAKLGDFITFYNHFTRFRVLLEKIVEKGDETPPPPRYGSASVLIK